jgi:hypothetical protein
MPPRHVIPLVLVAAVTNALAAWTQLTPTTSSSARMFAGMAFADACQRVVLFGGTSNFDRNISLNVDHMVPIYSDAEEAMNKMRAALYHGRRFRTLDVLDEGVRETLGRVPPVVFRRQVELENSTYALST